MVSGSLGGGQRPDFAPQLRGPWSKLEGFTARFALILSQLHQAYIGQEGPPRDVDALDMHHARLLSDYFKRHLERAIHGIDRRQIPDVAAAADPQAHRGEDPGDLGTHADPELQPLPSGAGRPGEHLGLAGATQHHPAEGSQSRLDPETAWPAGR